MNEAFHQEFIEETRQLLKNLGESLLKLEKQSSPEELNEAYRFLHTLKGSAGMFGFKDIENLSHELESLYSEMREGIRQPDGVILDISFHALDIFADLIEGKTADKEVDGMIRDIRQLMNRGKGPLIAASGNTVEKLESRAIFIILFRPAKTVFKRGINIISLLGEIYALGKYEQFVHNESIPLETQIKNKDLESWFEIFVETPESLKHVKEIFLFMQPSEYLIIPFQELSSFESSNYQQYITLSPEEIETRIELIKKINPDFLTAPTKSKIESQKPEDDEEQNEVVITRAKKGGNINVSTYKLDHLIDIVSELVIFRSELHHLMDDPLNVAKTEALEKLERLTLGLRDSAFNIRLVPLDTIKVKLQRLIRMVSKELGKEIDFITEGLHTELDRSMITALEAPLMHILRNAVDHGIEQPEEREAKNKPRKGLIKLYSYNSGDHIFIQLQDDGNGIDFDKIRKKGVEKGLLLKDKDYTEKELTNLMMTPGFSTSEKITTVSGRGVGMDVVKKEISALRGDFEISTEKGLGSIFTIRLPLTLTILDTLVTQVADKKYLLPINEIEHCFKEDHKKLFHKKGRQIDFNGELLPFVSLREQFKISDFPEQETVIVVNKNDKRLAVIVDEIQGTLQTVYKPLNHLLQGTECFSGASILGDGSIALIINPLKLID